MWKLTLLILILVVIALGLTIYKNPQNKLKNISVPPPVQTQSSATASASSNEDPTMQVIASNLEVPWALAHLPDKSILITERAGRVRVIDKDGKLSLNPVGNIAEVKQTGESGLHGVAIHPDFDNNHLVYFYYTYAGNGDTTLNRVSRYKLENNKLADETIIVDQIPGAVFHDGGRIKFGPDKFLYITTGDALNPSSAQDVNSVAGKILRVTDEGKAAPGNPFNNLVYSYGHRNPQGITWDDKGNLWETEHGQSATDEVNLINIGKNYGWPTIRGDQTRQGMVAPRIHSKQNTWAPAGMTYVSGSLFFAGLRGQALFQLNPNTMELKEHFAGELGRIREVVLGPDEMLYITTSNRDGRGSPQQDDDRIIRINPQKL